MHNSKIDQIRKGRNNVLVIGNHPQIIQSILDFDYLSGKKMPSIIGVIGTSDGNIKMFWGKAEILIPQFSTIDRFPEPVSVDWILNVVSGRRMLSTGIESIQQLKNLSGGVFFAENVPELHSLTLYNKAAEKNKLLIGPASVGLVVPGVLKLGAIGGITPEQIVESGLLQSGNVAVMSASGGMTNELISVVTRSGYHLSFGLSFGGDRFPLLTPEYAISMALEDPQTKIIVYYGELGGEDEYRLVDLIEKQSVDNSKKKTKIIAHIAGTVADLFTESPQFGHAKAKAETGKERASIKREALKKAGVIVTESFGQLGSVLKDLRI